MLKALHRFPQLLRVHFYVPGWCKYFRMTNGFQPLAALCMDGRFADGAVVGSRICNGGLQLRSPIDRFHLPGLDQLRQRLIPVDNTDVFRPSVVLANEIAL